jgi:hypothetical protein
MYWRLCQKKLTQLRRFKRFLPALRLNAIQNLKYQLLRFLILTDDEGFLYLKSGRPK